MPDDDAPDDKMPPRGDDREEVTARPWSSGDVVRLGTVDSTNRYALDAAAAGRPGGFVVVADDQSAGRGRRSRSWVAPAGGALLCSVLFRAHLDLAHCGLLTVAVAAAALDGIEAICGVRGGIKWPNDLMVDDRKVAGILAQVGGTDADGAVVVVVGIGVNLAFPDGWLDETIGDDGRPIGTRATSLELVAGRAPDRDTLIGALLDGLDRRVGHTPIDADLPVIVAEARSRSVTIGRSVAVIDEAGTHYGIATGITDTGRLEVAIDGAPVVFDAADVVHLR